MTPHIPKHTRNATAAPFRGAPRGPASYYPEFSRGPDSRACLWPRVLIAVLPGVLFSLAAIGYVLLASHARASQTTKGEKTVSQNELIDALRKLDPDQETAVDALSKRFIEEARAPARAAVSMLNDHDPKMSARAAAVVTNIEDLAIVPMVESPAPSAPADKVWNMDVALSAHLGVRAKVAARLNAMLADKTKIPWGKVGPGEGAPPPSRVCDEAYLMMRRLLNASEDKIQFVHERKAFLALSNAEKDSEILKAQKSHAWTNFTEGAE